MSVCLWICGQQLFDECMHLSARSKIIVLSVYEGFICKNILVKNNHTAKSQCVCVFFFLKFLVPAKQIRCVIPFCGWKFTHFLSTFIQNWERGKGKERKREYNDYDRQFMERGSTTLFLSTHKPNNTSKDFFFFFFCSCKSSWVSTFVFWVLHRETPLHSQKVAHT